MRAPTKMEELTPLEKFIGYAILGTIGFILMGAFIMLIFWLRNTGRIFLCFVCFVGAPVVVFVAQSLFEHFLDRRGRL